MSEMKKTLLLIAMLAMASLSVKAQTIFERENNSTYKITSSTSLGGSVKMTENIVVGYTSGNVSGKIVFSTKNKSIKFSDKKMTYTPEKFKIQEFEHFRLTTGKGTIPGKEGEIVFQLIEDLDNDTINILIQWPDFSAVKIAAERAD